MNARDRLVMSLEGSVMADRDVLEALVDALVLRVPLVAEYLAESGLEVAYRTRSYSVIRPT